MAARFGGEHAKVFCWNSKARMMEDHQTHQPKRLPPCRVVEQSVVDCGVCGQRMKLRTLKYQHAKFCRPLLDRRALVEQTAKRRIFDLQAQNEELLRLLGRSAAIESNSGTADAEQTDI
jgi:hypothetical protein